MPTPATPFDTVVLIAGFAIALILLLVLYLGSLFRPKDSPALAYFMVPVLTLMIIATLTAWVAGQRLPSEIQLPLLLSAGVVLLLMALSAVTVVFHHQQLTDPKEALGLPQGSVRAVIALTLILIFAISSIYLYSRNASLTTRTALGITPGSAGQATPAANPLRNAGADATVADRRSDPCPEVRRRSDHPAEPCR